MLSVDMYQDFVIYIEFTMSQLQIQQLMTSKIGSHIEYLIQTYKFVLNILDYLYYFVVFWIAK